jgi:hypothetical protein
VKDVYIDGAWRTVVRGEVYQGAWKAITRGEGYISGAWVSSPVASYSPGFELILSENNLIAETASSTVTSIAVDAAPSGGSAPFTYAWVKLSGAGSALSPSVATTAFRATGVPAYDSFVGVFRCTATDALGATAQADVTVEFTNTGG